MGRINTWQAAPPGPTCNLSSSHVRHLPQPKWAEPLPRAAGPSSVDAEANNFVHASTLAHELSWPLICMTGLFPGWGQCRSQLRAQISASIRRGAWPSSCSAFPASVWACPGKRPGSSSPCLPSWYGPLSGETKLAVKLTLLPHSGELGCRQSM